MVHDFNNCTDGDQGRLWRDHPPLAHLDKTHIYRYKRALPKPESEYDPNNSPRIASLSLSAKHLRGVGNHSSVYRAPFTLPPPLTTNPRSKDGRVTVIAKTAFSEREDRNFLKNEAHVFNTFSSNEYCHMQQEWSWLNDISGFSSISPVVPKFYGYYAPEEGISHKKLGSR